MEAPIAFKNDGTSLDSWTALLAPHRDLQIPHFSLYPSLLPAYADLFGLRLGSRSRMGAP